MRLTALDFPLQPIIARLAGLTTYLVWRDERNYASRKRLGQKGRFPNQLDSYGR